MNEGKAVVVAYFNFSKIFDTVSHNTLSDKLRKQRLDKETVRWNENCQAQRLWSAAISWAGGQAVVISHRDWKWIQKFNIFVNYMDGGTECTLSKFADDTELSEVFDKPDGCAVFQTDLSKLEKWANKNVGKFSWRNCKVLHLGRITPQTPVQAGGQLVGKQLCRNGPRHPGVQQVEHEPIIRPCRK